MKQLSSSSSTHTLIFLYSSQLGSLFPPPSPSQPVQSTMFCHFTYTHDYSITIMCCKVFFILLFQLLSYVRLFGPHGLQPTRILCPWDFPGNTGMGSHFLLHGIFPTQRSSPSLLHWQVDSLPLTYLGSQEDLIYSYQSLI